MDTENVTIKMLLRLPVKYWEPMQNGSQVLFPCVRVESARGKKKTSGITEFNQFENCVETILYNNIAIIVML